MFETMVKTEEKIKEAIKRTEFVVLGTIIYGKNLQRLGWQSADVLRTPSPIWTKGI